MAEIQIDKDRQTEKTDKHTCGLGVEASVHTFKHKDKIDRQTNIQTHRKTDRHTDRRGRDRRRER